MKGNLISGKPLLSNFDDSFSFLKSFLARYSRVGRVDARTAILIALRRLKANGSVCSRAIRYKTGSDPNEE